MNKKARLRKIADKLWYQKYLKGYCEVCGGNAILQGHHFYYKSSYSLLRYLKDNHITLCRNCHFILHHQDPKKIEEQIIQKRGKVWFNRLQRKSQERKSSFLTVSYYENVIAELEK